MRRMIGSKVVAGMALVIATACLAAQPKVAGPRGVTYHGGDGSDCKHAVVIKGADGETRLAEAQAAWLSVKYPGYARVHEQSTTEGKTQHTEITIRTADGQEKVVCFSGS